MDGSSPFVRCSNKVAWGRTLSAVGFLLALVLAPLPVSAQTLVVAPHPDDDIIIASGVIQRALARGEQVYVVFVTNGDFNGQAVGLNRQGEAVAAQAILGQPEDRLIFLGYPDGYVFDIRDRFRFPWDYPDPDAPLLTHHGVSATYASRGLGRMDYHRYRFGTPGLYTWTNLVGDLRDILQTLQPKHVVTTSQWDQHLDHEATFFLVQTAATEVIAATPGYNPTVHKMTVWPGDDSWPLPANPLTYFTEIPKPPFGNRHGANPLVWSGRESLDVPLAMQSTSGSNAKERAISAHASQGGVGGYIGRWLHKDEVFWTEQFAGTNLPPVPNAGAAQQVQEGELVTLDGSLSWDRNGDPLLYEWRQSAGIPVALSSTTGPHLIFMAPAGLPADEALEFELVVSDGALQSLPDAVTVWVRSSSPPITYGQNVAPFATITASSQRPATDQVATKVADGVASGYPAAPQNEWVTASQGAGAWIQMTWPVPVSVGKIVLYDRPNLSDQLLAGTLTFSDGSTLPIGGLPNNGTAGIYEFNPRTVTALRLTVTGVSTTTGNVGLAEFEVFELGGINRPPVANAGSNATVAAQQLVRLDGTGSVDPNGDPLTYRWTQTAGPPVALSNAAVASPTFIAPAALPSAQVLRFALVVLDAQFTSEPDAVDVTVPGTVNQPPIAHAGANARVSAGAVVTLDGSASSDPEGQPITYRWVQTGGAPVTLSSTTSVTPTFSVPVETSSQDLVFELTVHDGTHFSTPAAVTVAVVALPTEAGNIAPLASVTASSQRAPTQSAVKAVDRVVSGYPTDATREWVTVGQGVGAWIELRWDGAYVVDRVRLHDRPNTSDHVRRGTLLFSDGTSMPVGALNNDSTGVDLLLTPRAINWVRFTVEEVSGATGNVGLAEIMVFQQAGTSINRSPVAVAGPPQTVTGGTAMLLDGSASSDPEGHSLTFLWAQVGGPAVTLTNPGSAIASFTSPGATYGPQVLEFRLSVSDGVSSGVAVTQVSITPLPNAVPVVNAGPDQSVTPGSLVRLDGSASSDANNHPLTYRWTQVAGQPVALASATTAFPTFVAPTLDGHSEILMFNLVVNDGFAPNTAPDSVLVWVMATPDPNNIAPLATVTASTQRAPGQAASRVIDGMVSGFPAVRTNAEWATLAERAGAWVQLDWSTDQTIDRVRLYDRPNTDDHMTSGRLLFSDGTSVSIGGLSNSGWQGLEVAFPARTVRWVRLIVDTVGNRTVNVGLAEIEVLRVTSFGTW